MLIEQASLDRLTEWILSAHCQEGDRERILEFVRSLQDGSWRSRWYSQRDLAPEVGSERRKVWLGDHLVLFVVFDFDGYPDVVQVERIVAL